MHHKGDPEALKLGHSCVSRDRWGSVPPLMAVLSKSMKASCLDDPTYCLGCCYALLGVTFCCYAYALYIYILSYCTCYYPHRHIAGMFPVATSTDFDSVANSKLNLSWFTGSPFKLQPYLTLTLQILLMSLM